MDIWFFGDSFSTDHREGPSTEQQWHRVLSQRLGSGYHNFSIPGSSLGYTYYKWHEIRDQIQPGDLAIVTVTQPSRRWLCGDRPAWNTNPLTLADTEWFDWDASPREMKVAALQYFKYLYHEHEDKALLYNWLCSIDRVANRGVRVLLLPCFLDTDEIIKLYKTEFPHIAFAQGYLLDVGSKEHVMKYHRVVTDGRLDHLCLPNHSVLADKILDWYEDGKAVDLTSGFYTDIIADDLDDPALFVRRHVIERWRL